jgi:murein DD-endopeptidase MepM/ murein hydrolase activator NlpD
LIPSRIVEAGHRLLGPGVVLFVVLFLGEAGSAQEIRLSATEVKQGDVLIVRVDSSLDLDGRIEERRLDFFRTLEKDVQWALWGADVDERPGVKNVKVRMGTGSAQLESAFRVSPREFPSEELTVSSEFTDLSPSAVKRMETERAEIERVFSRKSASPLWAGDFQMPGPFAVTSHFGMRRTLNGSLQSRHLGVDFRAEQGAPVYAPNNGRIVLAREHFLTGKTLVLDHGSGLYSIFLHLSGFDALEGDSVRKGDLIGRVGSTGRATGPHLHWSVRLAGARVDPLALTRVNLSP